MQPFSRILSLPLLLAAATAAASAQADSSSAVPVIDTAGFTLGGVNGEPYQGVSLISELPGYVTFSLWGTGQASHTETDSRGSDYTSDEKEWADGYGLQVKEGYRITGITVSGEFYGALRPAQWSDPGTAGNRLGVGLFATVPGQLPMQSQVLHVNNVDGRDTFELNIGPAELTGNVSLLLRGYAGVWAGSAWYTDGPGEAYWLGSTADAGLSNLVMTVAVTPVPEPGTYVMLLAGLALLGAAGYRRAWLSQ